MGGMGDRNQWTQSWTKTPQGETRSYSSISSFQSKLSLPGAFLKGLGKPRPCSTACWSLLPLLGWLCLVYEVFPQKFHLCGFFNFPRTLLHLHFHIFTRCPLRRILPDLRDLPLKSGQKPPWPHNSCIIRFHNTMTSCMMLSSAISLSNSWVTLDHDY